MLFLLLGAFGLLALVLADLSHARRDAGDTPSSHWVQRFESAGHHRDLGIGLATVLYPCKSWGARCDTPGFCCGMPF